MKTVKCTQALYHSFHLQLESWPWLHGFFIMQTACGDRKHWTKDVNAPIQTCQQLSLEQSSSGLISGSSSPEYQVPVIARSLFPAGSRHQAGVSAFTSRKKRAVGHSDETTPFSQLDTLLYFQYSLVVLAALQSLTKPDRHSVAVATNRQSKLFLSFMTAFHLMFFPKLN